jgi:hypothetical protein
VWLDLETGRELAQSQVSGADRNECQLGPVFYASGKWWGLLGHGSKEAKRDLVEFTATTPLIPGPFGKSADDLWITGVPDAPLADLALVLPGWRPESNYAHRFQLVSADVRGESQIMSVKVEPAHEVRLLHVVDVPLGRKTSLQLRYGNSQDRKWTLVVRANGQTLLEQLVEEAGSANGWRDAIIDLTPFSGQRIPLQLIQSIPPQQQAADAHWKRAAIVVE